MVSPVYGASRVRRLQEGYLDPEDEFALAAENLDSLLSTARGLVGSMLAMCQAYDEELGDFREAVDAIREAVDTASSATGEFFDFMEELDEPEEEEEDGEEEGDEEEGSGEEGGEPQEEE